MPRKKNLARTVEGVMSSLSQLPQFKNYTQEQLKQKAVEQIESRSAFQELDINSQFETSEEKALASELAKKYLSDYTVQTESDKNTLRQLIFLEVLNLRLQTSLNTVHANTKASPKDLVDTVHKNLQQISSLKEKLGITREKEQLNTKDGYGYLQTVLKKYRVWLDNNQLTRYFTCPHCAKSVLLKKKMDAWEAEKHPFFRDRILGNEKLIELYKENKLTVEDLASIFGTSTDYVTWLVEKCWRLPLEEKTETNEKKDTSS